MRQELDAALAQRRDRADDVARGHRDVLRAGAVVELEVLVDLRLALALGGLVDRELDPAVAGRDDLGHQRRVLGRDRLVGEVDHLRHPEDVLVELDPRLHRAELDVADDVVDREQAGVAVARRAALLGVAGQERAVVAAAVDEAVHRVAVGGDRRRGGRCRARRSPRAARARRARRARAPCGRRTSASGTDSAITLHAVAVAVVVLGDLVVGAERAGQHEPDAALLQDVARCGRARRSPGPA